MFPKPRPKMEYEKVSTEDWTTGIIEDIQYEENRNTGFKDDEGNDKIADCVRFKFKLDGYKFPHRSNWMTYGYTEKSTLYIKYMTNLVEGAKPDMKFDVDHLRGMPIKIMWTNKGEFQNVEMVRPLKGKIPYTDKPAGDSGDSLDESEETTPF